MALKVLYVTESGIAVPYLTNCMHILASEGKVDLEHIPFGRYKVWKDRLGSSDVFVYQSLRDVSNPIQDDIFLNCGCRKFLFDSCDMGSWDRFKLFDPSLPRIKNTPHKDIMSTHNIVLSTTFPIRRLKKPQSNRDIAVSFRVKLRNEIRKSIRQTLLEYGKSKSVTAECDYLKKGYYPDYLARVLVSVNAPGNGEACIRHLLTIQAGSCMLAHESINGIKLLPNADLEEGYDYVSFNLENLTSKLDWLLSRPKKLAAISRNGQLKFEEGYPPTKTAAKLFSVLKG